MNDVIIHEMEQRSEAWFDIKLGRFSGTSASSLLMGKTTAGYQGEIAKVAAEILTGEKEDGFMSYDMQIGIDREPDALNAYQELIGKPVYQPGFVERVEPFWGEYSGVSPDGLVGDNGMVQIKCPKAKTIFGYYGQTQCPKTHYPQMQMELFITGREYNDFVAYYPGLKLHVVRVFPDPAFFAKLEAEIIFGVTQVQNIISKYNAIDHESEIE